MFKIIFRLVGLLAVQACIYSICNAGQIAKLNFGVLVIRNNQLWARGAQANGELGTGTTGYVQIPVPVVGMTEGVTEVSAGGLTACAVKRGAVYCWGFNVGGSLGDGTTEHHFLPALVPGMESGVTRVFTSGSKTCAIKDGGLWCWGGWDRSFPDDSLLMPKRVEGFEHGVTQLMLDELKLVVRDQALWCTNRIGISPFAWSCTEGQHLEHEIEAVGCGRTIYIKKDKDILSGSLDDGSAHFCVGHPPFASNLNGKIASIGRLGNILLVGLDNGEIWSVGKEILIGSERKAVPHRCTTIPGRIVELSSSGWDSGEAYVLTVDGDIWNFEVKDGEVSKPNKVEGFPPLVDTGSTHSTAAHEAEMLALRTHYENLLRASEANHIQQLDSLKQVIKALLEKQRVQ